jgi:hypothetical protein
LNEDNQRREEEFKNVILISLLDFKYLITNLNLFFPRSLSFILRDRNLFPRLERASKELIRIERAAGGLSVMAEVDYHKFYSGNQLGSPTVTPPPHSSEIMQNFPSLDVKRR